MLVKSETDKITRLGGNSKEAGLDHLNFKNISEGSYFDYGTEFTQN